jgi:tetratricopeptide (TPR) repeat protein
MDNSIDIIIERYITKQMDGDEAKKFEERLATEKLLNENYQTTLIAHRLIKEAGRLELKNSFQEYEAEMDPMVENKKVLPLWVRRSLPIAAILIVFMGVYQFGLFNRSMSVSEVYSDNFEVYSAPGVVRDSNLNEQSSWITAADYYRTKEYEEAIEWFSNAETEIPSYMAFFYKGVSYMAQNTPNYAMAIQNFETVLQSDNDYRQQALWYKGLALLKQNKRQDALTVFNEIVAAKSYNFNKAQAILKTDLKD